MNYYLHKKSNVLKLIGIIFSVLFVITFCEVKAQKRDTVFRYKDGAFIIKKNDKYRYVRFENGDTVIIEWKKMLAWLDFDKDLYYKVYNIENGLNVCGLFNSVSGQLELPISYNEIMSSKVNSIKVVSKGNFKGLYSLKNKQMSPVIYSSISYHFDNNISAFKDSFCFVYNENLEILDSIKGVFSVQRRIVDGNFLVVSYQNGEAIMDKSNKIHYNKEWFKIKDDFGFNVLVQTKTGIGLYNLNRFKLIQPYIYDSVVSQKYLNEFFLLRHKNTWKLIDSTGKELCNISSVNVKPDFAWQVFLYQEKGLWGAKNQKGVTLQTPKWKDVTPIDNGEIAYLEVIQEDGRKKFFLYQYDSKKQNVIRLKEYVKEKETLILEDLEIKI